MLAAGKVPIAIAVRNEGDSAEELVIVRRRSIQPHDIVVLPAAALNDVGVRAALGAVMAVHARVGVLP